MDRPTDDLVRRILAAAAARAGDRAAALVADAAAEAEAEVKALVKSAVKAALLQRAVDEMGIDVPPSSTAPEDLPPDANDPSAPAVAAATAPPGTDAAPAEPRGDVACYLYGIARASPVPQPPLGPAIDPAFPVRLVAHEDLRAIVSSVPTDAFDDANRGDGPPDVAWLERRVRAHDGVVKQAMAAGPVMPLRFGTVVRGDDDARNVLARHHDALATTLGTLDGKAEWGVKVRARHGAVADALERDASDPSGRNGQPDRSGRNYLLGKQRAARVDGAVRRTVRAWSQALHERLSSAAADAVVLPPQRPAVPPSKSSDADLPVLNAAYLVPDAGLEPFRRTFAALAREYEPKGLVFQLTGPWPAYNFARLDLTAEARA